MSVEDMTDSSVSFLQQQHAKTLRGLHEEISKLQQKCAKLTFDLTMAGGGQGGSEVKSAETCELQKVLMESQQNMSTLNNRLEMLESQNALIKHEKHQLMRKFEDQISEKDTLIMSLHTQLEEKSNTVAQLVHKLHQAQRLVHKGGVALKQEGLFPVPPKDPPPPPESVHRAGRITRRLRRPNNTNTLTPPPDLSSPSGDSIDEITMKKPPLITGSLPSVEISNPPLSHRLSQSYDHTENGLRPSSSQIGLGERIFDRSLTPVAPQKQTASHNFITIKKKLKTQYRQKGQRSTTNNTVLPPIKDEIKLPPLPLEAKPPRSHRRFHLAKSQGLTSAPPCSVRLTNYKQVGEMENEDIRNEGGGHLLVKHEVGESNGTMLNHIHQQSSK